MLGVGELEAEELGCNSHLAYPQRRTCLGERLHCNAINCRVLHIGGNVSFVHEFEILAGRIAPNRQVYVMFVLSQAKAVTHVVMVRWA